MKIATITIVIIGLLLLVGCQNRAVPSTGGSDGTPEKVEQPPTSADRCGRCGDGVIDCGEVCDDGNRQTEHCADIHPEATPTKTCGPDCRWTYCVSPRCGNGTVEGREECDEGAPSRNCDASCRLTACGKLGGVDDDYPDRDCDGVLDVQDNCPDTFNPAQQNSDSDPRGDACQSPPAECSDGYCGTPGGSNGGGCGCGSGGFDPGDLPRGGQYADDFDNDGYEDEYDNCPFVFNISQADADHDGVGDACDPVECPADCS